MWVVGIKPISSISFSPGNEDIFELPLPDLYIKLDNCSIKTFLELSPTIITERLKALLKEFSY